MKSNISLTPTVINQLSTIKDKLVEKQEIHLSMLKAMEPIDVLKKGISLSTAPFELAGRLARKGWQDLYFNKESDSWTVWTIGLSMREKVSWEEIESMLMDEE